MTGPKHSCGVVGIAATYNVVPALHKTLMIIQHRGQESAGITVFKHGGDMQTVKDNGLVQVALSNEKIGRMDGNVGIGHVRYSTTGSKNVINAQPLTVTTSFGVVAIAHNGDITNYKELKEKYLATGISFLTDSDSELVTKILSKYMLQSSDPIRSMKNMMMELEGAYALAIMINDRLFGIRDPYGLRPLCIGKICGGHMVVSESAAIDAMGGTFVRNVAPGEIVEVMQDQFISHPSISNRHRAYCMFEWVYFARPDSVIDEREVYDVRKKIGEILARECPADVDMIMPIPDSGRAHAIGFSIASGIPYEEGFMKNRFAERTFILPDQREREAAVSMKMNPIKSTVEGKKMVIVDDSIVRGTTLKKLIQMLRKAGAKEVHVRIGSPPVIAPCYYGVDMKTRDQFVANGRSTEEVCKIIGADSLGYISIEGLIEAIEKPESELCLACVNGKYPTRIPGEMQRFQSTLNSDF
ncbi:glutamine--fructose-6-phosphate aminotransferase [Candidatus Methanoplasma termitum]|uniref:Amidophosphoribosyltransferase n=1 Tax=Candidatus Methanoplasma termitum TaxID=1577791 RepID=A0A0A7LEH6_9ARCH|nr:amidophosphoribosyltransferase [Candidatus Methanoplasma termitum]AIZ56707.1 glutamine--fructose-6-phosphate aminotransferase [Candidatus Methanoplasma termitum]MCL2333359.1 amidophosphoribosyltransferase [Candidatus Methanoplasma sp.]